MRFNLDDATIYATDSAELAYAMYKKHGYVLIKGLFKDDVDALNNDLEPYIATKGVGVEHMPESMREFAGRNTKRLTRVPILSQTFRDEFLNNSLLLSCLDTIFKEVSDSYWLCTAQIMEVQPGEKAQILHRDLEVYPIFKRYGKEAPEVIMNCIVALSDYTEEMGATRAIPGSHLWDDYFQPGNPEDTYPIEMEKGDAFLMSGKTIHGAGANITMNKPRRAMAMGFNVGWLTPEEALPLIMPLEMAKTMTQRAQQMLGFRSFHNTVLEGGSLWTVDFEELGEYFKRTETAAN
ncbi:phytanoyl-CoA dioxygenase family protein [Mangrovibacter yixingensis]|uniref:phytanoyl-CoA dioxygenase family protein n=1 Tax=Mangrovibacter yixingensis TaxID=1529639 RepID=UPI001CFA9447|nr:phytanoyl-CoA dioxygenase family protein [Mangrovibacter yixingensis]